MPSIFHAMRGHTTPNMDQRASSWEGKTSPLSGLLRRSHTKPLVRIKIDNDRVGMCTYTSRDTVTGHVSVEFAQDSRLLATCIVLEGKSTTSVPSLVTGSYSQRPIRAARTFLLLRQPVTSDALSAERVIHARARQMVPFSFDIPSQLPLQTCTHDVSCDEIRDAHLLLPPSLGDRVWEREYRTRLNDLAPDMITINYEIKATVYSATSDASGSACATTVAVPIRIVPAGGPELLMPATEGTERHSAQLQKCVYEKLSLSSSSGVLRLTIPPPCIVRLPPAPSTSYDAPMASIPLNLHFEPRSEGVHPPRLIKICGRLKVYTCFGARPFDKVPNVDGHNTWYKENGTYETVVKLFARDAGYMNWLHKRKGCQGEAACRVESHPTFDQPVSGLKHTPTMPSPSVGVLSTSLPVPLTLRPSTATRVNVDGSVPQRGSMGGGWTGLRNAFALQGRHTFVPTFYSCSVSRTYDLELSLYFKPSNSSRMSLSGRNTLTVRLPLHVSCQDSTLALSPPTYPGHASVHRPLDALRYVAASKNTNCKERSPRHTCSHDIDVQQG